MTSPLSPQDLAAVVAQVQAALPPTQVGEGFPNPVAQIFQAGDTIVITSNGLLVYNGPVTGPVLASISSAGSIQAQTATINTDIVFQGQSLSGLLYGLLNPYPWQPMTLLNGTSGGSTPNAYPAYRYNLDTSQVYIAGVVGGVKSNTVFATLPAGFYNPTTQTQFPVAVPSGYSSAPVAQPYLQCDTSGNLTISNAPGGGASSTVVLSGYIDLYIPASASGGGQGVTTTTSSFYPSHIYTYEQSGTLRNEDGTYFWQGGNSSYTGDYGSQYAFLNFAAVTATIPSGATINWANLRLYCTTSWDDSGTTVHLRSDATLNSYGGLSGYLDSWGIGKGAILAHTLNPAVLASVMSGNTWLVLGASPWGSTDLSQFGVFCGLSGSTSGQWPQLVVNWTH